MEANINGKTPLLAKDQFIDAKIFHNYMKHKLKQKTSVISHIYYKKADFASNKERHLLKV